MSRKLKVLDLFSGIGGFALGLDSTGFFETVKFVEMDKYCQKVLRKNFPNIPIEEDIKNVEGKEYEADVVVGGFPCQPFSVAGKQKGTNDNRYLWPEMLRLIKEIKPEFVIGENVQGIINLQNGMVLRQVQDELESEGFEVQCFLIPASGIGAWHQRYRVWIVGHSQHNGLLAAEKRCRDEKDYGGSQKGENETIEPTRTSGSKDNEDVSNTENWIGQSTERQGRESIRRGSDDRIWSKGKRENIKTDVSNTDTRLSIGENEEVQTRRDTVDSSSSRGGDENVSNTKQERLQRYDKLQAEQTETSIGSVERGSTKKNVSDTEIIGTRESRNIDQEKRNESSGSTQSNSSSQDVSNTNSGIRGGGRTIGQSGENKVWRFYSEEEEQTTHDLRSETIGRDALFREEKIILQSNNERQQESNTSKESEGQTLDNRRYDKHERDVTDTNEQRTQVSTEGEYTGIEMFGSSSQKTWWQTQSDLCGVPNGISYGLDKNRANRIKTLGNAIVPQIAREIGLAIKKVVSEDII